VKVIVQPQNGYINRIQALASSALLAREIDAEFEVQWVSDSTAPADSAHIFSPEFLKCFASEPEAWSLEPYLNYDSVSRVVTLAGLDRGEQVFMPELEALLQSGQAVSEIRISAGGKFSLGGAESVFASARAGFYREELVFSAPIESAVASELADRGEYLGLHLRYSDRNHQAPTRKQTLKAVQELARISGIPDVFIATDTPSDLPWWKSELENIGLSVWWVAVKDWNRNAPEAALGALVDWQLLTKSHAMVYFSESSFGEEASVCCVEVPPSVALVPSLTRGVVISLKRYLDSLFTYPKRHWRGR
jgi:hypothetical protein